MTEGLPQQQQENNNNEDYFERLIQIGASISQPTFERLQTLFVHEQQMDSFRSAIFSKLTTMARPLLLTTTTQQQQNFQDWDEKTLNEKCILLDQIQDLIYDLQLIESTSNFQTFSLANAIFALNKKRCTKKILIGWFYFFFLSVTHNHIHTPVIYQLHISHTHPISLCQIGIKFYGIFQSYRGAKSRRITFSFLAIFEVLINTIFTSKCN